MNTNNPLKSKKYVWIPLLSASVIVFLIIAAISGGLSYGIATVRCWHQPIVGQTGFKDSRTYYRPSDSGKLTLHGKYFCNENEAIKAGYRNTNTGSLFLEQEALRMSEQINAESFSSKKIDYVAYVPTYLPDGYSLYKTTIIENEVFSDFIKGGSIGIELRQGVGGRGAVYSACRKDESSCKDLGMDDQSRNIYYMQARGNKRHFWGVDIDNTYLTLSSNDLLPTADVARIFSSMTPMN